MAIARMKRFVATAYILFLVFWLMFTFSRAIGPVIESMFIEPVPWLGFSSLTCNGPDLEARGVMMKAKYPIVNVGADLVPDSFGVRTADNPHKSLGWRRLDPNNNSPQSRSYGLQQINLYILEGCGKSFELYAKHISPISGVVISSTWGGFNEKDLIDD